MPGFPCWDGQAHWGSRSSDLLKSRVWQPGGRNCPARTPLIPSPLCAQIPTLVEKARHAEAGIDKLSDKTQDTVNKVQDQVQQGADKTSEKIVPMAADASRTINSVRAFWDPWRPIWASFTALLRQIQWGHVPGLPALASSCL